jgi:hypothetical protein
VTRFCLQVTSIASLGTRFRLLPKHEGIFNSAPRLHHHLRRRAQSTPSTALPRLVHQHPNYPPLSPPTHFHGNMSSYLSNLLTTTTSRYNSLRRTLLSDDADGDTEDDSHISRVLRAYYTEKGRPYPQWLPPDPKAPQPAPAQFASGRQQGPPQMGRGGGLSDLWDAPAQQPPQQQPLSLRAQRGGTRAYQGRQPMGQALAPEPQSRPLPSQREGSYQSQSSFSGYPEPSPPLTSSSGTSAQDRLKARLWGAGRSNSPVQNASASAGTSPAATRSPYERPSAGRPPYPTDRGSSGYSSGGGGRQQSSQQGMSANAPWQGNSDPYAQGGGGYGGAPQRAPPGGGGRVGLPSGPRMRSS